jgi:RNA polymerase sigma-70 factor (ECF subfamily)
MLSIDTDFRTLLAGIRAGSEDAAWRIIELYGPHIHRVVHRLLDRRLRSQYDSVDFVQAVWASFFREPNRIRSFESPSDLTRYLAATTRNKVIDEARRRLGTRKFDVRRVHSFDDSAVDADQLRSGSPSPEEVAIAREAWSRLVAGQPQQYREVARLRFQGATYPEIAARLEIHERTARKVIERLSRMQVA